MYASSVVKFSFEYRSKVPTFEWINQYNYIRTKISYIPAERNIVSMISDWKQVNLPKNNIFNFMSDWNIARKVYTVDNGLDIKSLDTKYYYDENQDIDFLETLDGNKIQLINASSGQQSMIPLYTLVNYFTKSIYEGDRNDNIDNKERDAKLLNIIISKSLSEVIDNKTNLNNEKWLHQYLKTILKVTKENEKIHLPKAGETFFKFTI